MENAISGGARFLGPTRLTIVYTNLRSYLV